MNHVHRRKVKNVKFTTKVTSGVALAGAATLGVGLLVMSPGVGATFTDSAQAKADINVGTLACKITTTDPSAHVINDGRSVSIPLGTISSSVASQKTAPISVVNMGTIPMYVSWDISTSGNFFTDWYGHKALPIGQNYSVAAGASGDYSIGALWDELQNRDMGTSGEVTYTANCSDQSAKYWLSSNAGGEATVAGKNIDLTIPAVPNSGPGAQFPGASIGLAITSGQALPTTQPKFESTGLPSAAAPGTLRLRIVLSDGTAVVVNSDNTLNNGAGYTWQQALGASSGKTVSSVTLIADNSYTGGFTAAVSCIDYSGTPEFGSC